MFFQSKGLTMRDVFTLQALFVGVVCESRYMADFQWIKAVGC